MLCCDRLTAGRMIGVKLGAEDGVVASFSTDLVSEKLSRRLAAGVEGRGALSGDLVGDGGFDCWPLSKSRLRSRTLPG